MQYLTSIREKINSLLPNVIQEIYKDYWNTVGYGAKLHSALCSVLELLRGSAFVVVDLQQDLALACVGVTNWNGEQAALNLDSGQNGNSGRIIMQGFISDYVKNICRLEAARMSPGSTKVIPGDVRYCDYLILFTPGGRTQGSGKFSGILFRKSGIARLASVQPSDLPADFKDIENDLRLSIGAVVLPIIFDAFRYHERRFAAFPGRVREEYWQDVLNTCRPLLPPWDVCATTRSTVKTVTLSLDLRKSTYCMEYASSNRKFGHWLELFTEKMRSVSHRHGGIYDKFTGDGSLVHFLERECNQIFNRSSVDAAVHCAADMQRVVERHMMELRRFLQHDSEIFGAGIAIDINDAYWACDDRDNPVVVGRGVVGACRVGDKAPRQTIRLTNLAYNQIGNEVRQKLLNVHKESLETKETSGGLPLQCWQFDARSAEGLGLGYDAMNRLCMEVYNRLERKEI